MGYLVLFLRRTSKTSYCPCGRELPAASQLIRLHTHVCAEFTTPSAKTSRSWPSRSGWWLLNESIPHPIAAFLTHILTTTWSSSQLPVPTSSGRTFNRLPARPRAAVSTSAELFVPTECYGGMILSWSELRGGSVIWADRRSFYQYRLLGLVNLLHILPCQGWLIRFFCMKISLSLYTSLRHLDGKLSSALVSLGSTPGGPSLTIRLSGGPLDFNRIYGVTLTFSIDFQLPSFCVTAAMCLWVDLIQTTANIPLPGSRDHRMHCTCSCSLGKCPSSDVPAAVLKESRTLMSVFILISTVMLGGWGGLVIY